MTLNYNAPFVVMTLFRTSGAVYSILLLQLQGIANTVTKQRIESHFDLELRAAVMVRTCLPPNNPFLLPEILGSNLAILLLLTLI